MKALSLLLYSVTLNVMVQLLSLLFQLYWTLSHQLFLSVMLLSLTVSIASYYIEHFITLKLSRNKRFSNYVSDRQYLSSVFSGKVKMVYLLGAMKTFRHGIWYECLRNVAILFKVFLFIPAFIFLSTEVKRYIGPDIGGFLGINPFSIFEIHGFRVLPWLMFVLSVASGFVFFGKSRDGLVKHVGLSLLFLVLLYSSPSLLVVYWCLNITFSALVYAISVQKGKGATNK